MCFSAVWEVKQLSVGGCVCVELMVWQTVKVNKE